MQTINQKYFNIGVAAGLAFILELIVALGFYMTYDPSYAGAHRLFKLLGGDLPLGLIQAFTFFLFFYGMLDVRTKNKAIETEQLMFNRELLPIEDNDRLSVTDIEQLRQKLTEIERRNPSVLGGLIRKSAIAFLSNKSINDTLNLISTHIRIKQADSDSEQALIRYVAWAVPSVGFIGTVIGIAASLGIANQATSENGIKAVTDLLEVAFDSTLIALLLDTVFVFYVHSLQERSEKLYSQMEAYMIENFINRIN